MPDCQVWRPATVYGMADIGGNAIGPAVKPHGLSPNEEYICNYVIVCVCLSKLPLVLFTKVMWIY